MSSSRLRGRKVLFIGGTGRISSACSRRAVELGADLHLLNRNLSSVRPAPEGATVITADVRDTDGVRAALIGDKAHAMVFGNSKVRRVVPESTVSIPFARGAREIVAWHDEDPSRRVVHERLDALMDRLIDTHRPRPA